MLWVALLIAIIMPVATFMLLRFAKLPPWGHRDLLAFMALVATIGGAMILTMMKWIQTDKFNQQTDRLISELVRERPTQVNNAVGGALNTIVDALTWDLKLTSVGIIVVLLSLGLVISSRIIKGKVLGNEFELSTPEAVAAAKAAGARATADAADDKAEQIAADPAAVKSDDGELPESEKIR